MIYLLEPALTTDDHFVTNLLGPGKAPVCLCGLNAYRVRMIIDPHDTLNFDRDRLIQEQQE